MLEKSQRKVYWKYTYNFLYVHLWVSDTKSKKGSWIEWKIFQRLFNKKIRTHIWTQFKIEFLLLSTGYWKTLEKLPDLSIWCSNIQILPNFRAWVKKIKMCIAISNGNQNKPKPIAGANFLVLLMYFSCFCDLT